MESPPPAVFHDKAKRTQQGNLLALHGLSTMLQGAPQKILQSQIREHGVSLENIKNKENTEKMEKMENINQMTLTMIQNITLLLRKKLNLSTRSSTLFYGIFLRRSKNHGEHESGSDQNWRISSNCCAQYK